MFTLETSIKLIAKLGIRKCFPALLVLVTIGFGSQVHASILYDDFNDNTLNSLFWVEQIFGNGVTIKESNQHLEVNFDKNASTGSDFAPLGAGYRSVDKLSGDFDIAVDYDLRQPTWPSQNGVRVGLLVTTQEQLLVPAGTNNNMAWAVVRHSGGKNENFGEQYIVDFGGVVTGAIATSDLFGSLRLQRIGNKISAYYLSATDWVNIQENSIITTDPLYFGVAAWSHDLLFSDKDVKVAFDNVRVVPLPASIVLFGSSILSMLLFRKKAA